MFHQKLIGECLAGKNSSTDENYSSYYHFNPYFLNDQPNLTATWTSQASDFESEWMSIEWPWKWGFKSVEGKVYIFGSYQDCK